MNYLISKKNNSNGFTLLEILLVVGIIAILAGIVIIAINPSKQLAMARNTERKSDLKQINNALEQYYIDHREYPDTLLSDLTDICDTGSTASSSVESELGESYCDDFIDLSVLVPTYITAIPKDPQASTTASAGYQVKRHSSNGKIGLSATGELNQVITVNIPPDEVVVDACGVSGDATDADCWSAEVSKYWGGYPSTTGVSTSTTLSNGKSNTAILAGLSGNYPAADHCYNLTDGDVSVGTWYLPSYKELEDGWLDLGSDGFPSGGYWSSTEYSGTPNLTAWYLLTAVNGLDVTIKSDSFSVRCLR